MTPEDRKKQREQHLVWLTQLIAQAQLRGFYGTLSVTMEDGVIRRVVKEESLKPPPVS